MTHPLIIGHRGAMGYRLQNQRTSFEEALRQLADGIECDIQLTADGQLVVFHDYHAEELLGICAYVKDLTLAQMRSASLIDIQYGETGLTVPTFSEYIEIVKSGSGGKYKPLLFVEMKFRGDDTATKKVEMAADKALEEIARYSMESRTVFLSFYHPVMREIRLRNHKVKTGVLFEAVPRNPNNLALDVHADYLMPNHETVSEKMVSSAHAKGLKLSAWTVNEHEDVRRMLDIGVDAITTNYPGRVRAQVEATAVGKIYEELILKKPAGD